MAYFEKTNIADEVGVIINPATEEKLTEVSSKLDNLFNADSANFFARNIWVSSNIDMTDGTY